MHKKIIKILFLFIILIMFIGCDNENKTYKEDDFRITLPNEYIKIGSDTYNYYFKHDSVIITALKEEISSLDKYNINGESTTEDYMKVVSKLSNKEYEIINENNYSYMEYESKDNYHLAVVFKSKDSFWLINYMCLSKDKETRRNEFFNINKSIEI